MRTPASGISRKDGNSQRPGMMVTVGGRCSSKTSCSTSASFLAESARLREDRRQSAYPESRITLFTRGVVLCSPRVLQNWVIGQARHCGLRGRHTVAPNSIMAWLKSPGVARSTRRAASSPTLGECAASASQPAKRQSTRSTLPSTTAMGSLYAMLAMAAAV